jgi:hypothetical protein
MLIRVFDAEPASLRLKAAEIPRPHGLIRSRRGVFPGGEVIHHDAFATLKGAVLDRPNTPTLDLHVLSGIIGTDPDLEPSMRPRKPIPGIDLLWLYSIRFFGQQLLPGASWPLAVASFAYGFHDCRYLSPGGATRRLPLRPKRAYKHLPIEFGTAFLGQFGSLVSLVDVRHTHAAKKE